VDNRGCTGRGQGFCPAGARRQHEPGVQPRRHYYCRSGQAGGERQLCCREDRDRQPERQSHLQAVCPGRRQNIPQAPEPAVPRHGHDRRQVQDRRQGGAENQGVLMRSELNRCFMCIHSP